LMDTRVKPAYDEFRCGRSASVPQKVVITRESG